MGRPFKRSQKPSQASGDVDTAPTSEQAANPAPAAPVDETDAIPPHVWTMLQQAGEEATRRLLQLLQSPSFGSHAPTAQARLIELAMTRAYGLPVRRSVNLDLSSTDADAVAASLLKLQDHLPERRGMVDITPDNS